MMSAITAGNSLPARYEMHSCISESPGPEEPVMVRSPAEAAP